MSLLEPSVVNLMKFVQAPAKDGNLQATALLQECVADIESSSSAEEPLLALRTQPWTSRRRANPLPRRREWERWHPSSYTPGAGGTCRRGNTWHFLPAEPRSMGCALPRGRDERVMASMDAERFLAPVCIQGCGIAGQNGCGISKAFARATHNRGSQPRKWILKSTRAVLLNRSCREGSKKRKASSLSSKFTPQFLPVLGEQQPAGEEAQEPFACGHMQGGRGSIFAIPVAEEDVCSLHFRLKPCSGAFCVSMELPRPHPELEHLVVTYPTGRLRHPNSLVPLLVEVIDEQTLEQRRRLPGAKTETSNPDLYPWQGQEGILDPQGTRIKAQSVGPVSRRDWENHCYRV
eukprot:2645732-Amphidinium_carterae.1